MDFLLATDPGLDRLRQAARALVTVAVAALTLFMGLRFSHEASNVAFVGIMVAMISTMVPLEPDLREQRITTLLFPVVASAGVTVGALLAGSQALSIAALLAVIFAAIFARRFGTRATALGMVGFQAYFVVLFFHATLRQVPLMIAGIAVVAVVSHAVRFYLLPERPEKNLARAVTAFHAGLSVLLRRLARAVAAPRFTARMQRGVRRDLERLNELAFGVEVAAIADSSGGPEEAGGGERPALRMKVFEMELSAGRIGHAAWLLAASESTTARSRQAIAAALRGAGEAIRLSRGEPAPEMAALQAEELAAAAAGAGDLSSHELAAALHDLLAARAIRAEGSEAAEGARAPEGTAPAAPPAEAANAAEGAKAAEATQAAEAAGLQPSTRAAIQATVAAGLAAAAGWMISPPRWYWAVLAAWVIFARGTTRGEMTSRALQRISGTVGGVVAGLALGHVLAGHKIAEITLLFVCLFLAVYSMRRSYALMAMWITTMLALLYGVTGQLTPQILYLRILLTLVGAGIGAIVASTVLPSRTRAQMRAAMAALLRELSVVFDAIAARALSPAARPLLREHVRKLDRALSDLRQSATPLTGRFVKLGAPATSLLVHDATGLTHYARHLARLSASASLSEPALVTLRRACEELSRTARAQAAALERRMAGEEEGEREGDRAGDSALAGAEAEAKGSALAQGSSAVASSSGGDPAVAVMARWLARVEQLFAAVGERLHLRLSPSAAHEGDHP